MSVDAPTFTSYGKADFSQTFVVKTSGGFFNSRTVSATMSKEGVLTDGSFETTDETLPIAIKVGETAFGLGVMALTRGSGGVPLNRQNRFVQKTFRATETLYEETAEDRVNKLLVDDDCYRTGFAYHQLKMETRINELPEEIRYERRP